MSKTDGQNTTAATGANTDPAIIDHEMTGVFVKAIAEIKAETARCGGDVAKALRRIDRRRSDASIAEAMKKSRDGENHWSELCHGLGRNDLPFLLMMTWHTLPDDQRGKAVGDAWTGAEFPERVLQRDEWLEMYRAAGYHDDGRPTAPPEQVTLWRGGVKKTRMSWTADPEQAIWFQHRFDAIQPGKLWTVTVDADRLLAHYDQKHRHEDEYVIDPTGLRPLRTDPSLSAAPSDRPGRTHIDG